MSALTRQSKKSSLQVRCRCVTCKAERVYTDADPIDEAGPTCERCLSPMVPVNAQLVVSEVQS